MAEDTAPSQGWPGDLTPEVRAQLHDYAVRGLAGRLGVRITEASAERVVATMPVDGNHQPYGLLHGGASCVLAESLGSTGAAIHAGPGRIAVGIEINASHHRAATGGTVTGVASAVHLGGTVATYQVALTDEWGRRICTARITCLIREAPGGRRP
ncbi:MAG: PaaI family thioesterase [Streptomycetales bacterium]